MIGVGLTIPQVAFRGGRDLLAPNAPILTWTTDFTDTTPGLLAEFDESIATVDDEIVLQVDDNTGFTSPSESTDVLDAGEISAADVTFAASALLAGNYYARVKHVHYIDGTPHTSPWSNVVTINIGKIIIGYGQSNWLGHMTVTSSPPAAGTGTSYWDGSTWTAPPAGNGVRELLNFLTTDTGYPWGIISGGATGVSIASLSQGNGSGHYEALAAQIAASGGRADFIVWHQGEGNADGIGSEISIYLDRLDTLHGDLCDEVGKTKTECPIVVSSLATTTSASTTDANWEGVQVKLRNAGTITGGQYSHSNVDAVRTDTYHYDAASMGRSGRRYGQTIAKLLTTETLLPQWFATAAARVDTTHTDITVVHAMGTDFTPTTGITGFEISDDSWATSEAPSAAVRQDATTIRLTHSDLGTVERRIRYQYGKLPDVTDPCLDNSALAIPLNFSAGDLVAEAGAASVVDISFTDSSVDPTDLTTYTFSTQSFGAEAADRKIVVAVGFRSSGTPNFSSVTIGGVAATLVINEPTGINQDHAAIYIADVPTGTTGDVVVVLTAGASRCGIGVWRMTGAASSTPTDTGSSQADPGTTTLTIAANGGGIGYGTNISGSTATWTGLVEDFDEAIESTVQHSGAHLNSVAGGDISVSIDLSGTPSNMRNVFASWAP